MCTLCNTEGVYGDLREGVCALSVILRGLWGLREGVHALSVILRGLWG